MYRLAAFLLLLPLVLSSPPYFEWDHEFSEKVKACQDFHKFVCNPGGNGKQSFTYQLVQKFNNKIVDAASSYSDPLFDYILEVAYKDARNETLFKSGLKIGEDASKYKGGFLIQATLKEELLEITDIKMYDNADDLEEVVCLYKYCPTYVRGIVLGYMNHTYKEELQNLDNWEIRASYVRVETPEITPKKRKQTIRKLFSDPLPDAWYVYLNLISSNIATEKSLWIAKETEEELNYIGEVLVEETVAQIQKQAWIPIHRKMRTIQSIKNMTKYLTVPDATKNLRNIKTALRFYTTEFVKYKDDFIMRLASQSCDFNCHSVAITTVMILAKKKYDKMFSESDKHIKGFETAIYHFNAYNNKGRSMGIPPASQLYMMDTLPLGLRWSKIAYLLGHELYHSLDPNAVVKYAGEDYPKASANLVGLPEYDEAAKCYEDYYGSLVAKAPNGTIRHPNGTLKRGEGFADVEGMRAIIRVLKKTVFSKRLLKATYSYSTYNDLEWFFLGSQMMNCDHVEKSDFETFINHVDDPHARPTVRMNALVRQLDEFKEVFGCKRGDPMYTVEKPCKAFP